MSAREFCTLTASTKRNEDLGSGRTGAAIENLTSLAVTPLWPVSAETRRVLELNSPREFKECFHVPVAGGALPDVVEGDILVLSGAEYPVHYVAEWPGINTSDLPSLQIVVQEVKGS